MSFREITMQDVSEVLRRWQAGQSARRIAREMGIDRKTVGRYVEEAKAAGLVSSAGPILDPSPAFTQNFGQALVPRSKQRIGAFATLHAIPYPVFDQGITHHRLSNDHVFSGGAQAPSAATRG
jgi:DNA-binding Lrp family transcriptional regulator